MPEFLYVYVWQVDLTRIDKRSKDSWFGESDLEKNIDFTKIHDQSEARKIDWLAYVKLLPNILLCNT